jgi:hypothetical protein
MSKTVVFTFGRMNPPTNGHGKLITKVKRLAQTSRADHLIVSSHSQDKNKNPLDTKTKVKHLKGMFPNSNIKSSDTAHPSFIKQLALLTGKYDNLIFVAGSDRVPEFERLLKQYNGKDFKFKTIKVVSSGDRDPDAEGVTGISASTMRLYAKNNDFTSFKRGIPAGYRGAKKLFNDVRDGMELKESYLSFSFFIKD